MLRRGSSRGVGSDVCVLFLFEWEMMHDVCDAFECVLITSSLVCLHMNHLLLLILFLLRAADTATDNAHVGVGDGAACEGGCRSESDACAASDIVVVIGSGGGGEDDGSCGCGCD